MKIIVKILRGRECIIDTTPSETVLELKRKVSDVLGIAIPQQKLLYTGKALADENPLSFYPTIGDGSKLNLVIKKTAQSQNEEKDSQSNSGTQLLRKEMSRVLRHYYTESETESIVNEFVKDLKNKVNNLSFDDLERLATALLQDQESIP